METKEARPKRQFAVHPLLFAAFPVLYLYVHNIQEGVSTGDLLRTLALVVGATGILLAIATLVLRDQRKAALAVSALVLLFFSYGHAYLVVKGWRIAGVVVGRHKVLMSLWLLLVVAAVVLSLRAAKWARELTTVLNVVAATLVLINVVGVFQYQARSHAAERAAIQESQAGFQGRLPDPAQVRNRPSAIGGQGAHPDIYYIMLEEYGGERGLSESFDFDNTAFLSRLETRGFYVAHQTTVNYPRTSLSLASSLNMEYLDFLTAKVGRDSDDARPLTRLIEYNRVGRFLQSIGYRYVQIGSWWEPTRVSPIADQNVIYGGLSEFDRVLYGTTLLRPVREEQFRRREWKRVQFAFNAVAGTKSMRGPKFVFAHILVPHGPYVFYRDGRYKTEDEAGRHKMADNYLEQLLYANSQVERLMDTLLSGPQESRPVIVLQSDEGPFEGSPSYWTRILDKNLVRKFPILNAFYMPGASHADLYPTISPVNSFRLVLRLYFGADLAMLPDRNYIFRSIKRLYDFTDVTDRVRGLMSAGDE